jgi:HSP90 family molecular chaperone
VQSNRVMAQLKKLVTAKVTDTLKSLAKDKPEVYANFWKVFGRAIKQGVAMEQVEPENLYSLLRFHTTTQPAEWSSLDDYIGRMKPEQDKIYYILGDDERSIAHSPHLDPFRKSAVEVLALADPMDSFMLLRLQNYQEKSLVNVAAANTELPKSDAAPAEEQPAPLPGQELADLVGRFKTVLGERVTSVRATDRLTDSPARLVDPDGTPDQSIQRVYRLLNKEFEAPKKVLEINPRHALMARLSALPADDPRAALVIEQLYEDALLIEGIHPDPASMIGRIQELMAKALE